MPCSTPHRIAFACLATLAGACAAQPATDPPAEPIVETTPRLFLLGEVHDNAEGHRQRLEELRLDAKGSADMAIAMEQFDREHQAALDAAMARCAEAACVIAAASPGKSSWNWDYYAPVIQLALDHDIPLLAANLSRADAAGVVEGGFAVLPERLRTTYLDRPLPDGLLAAQVEAVRAGHCNMLPEAMLEPMARAQIARDVVMADTLVGALADHELVFLLAGNGHVDRRVGVSLWLGGSGVQWVATGYVEDGDIGDAWFDSVQPIPPVQREDPCAAFARSRGDDQ